MAKMTDKGLAAAVLDLLGYEKYSNILANGETQTYWQGGIDIWYGSDFQEVLASHDIAAEVKEFMCEKGYTWEEDSWSVKFGQGIGSMVTWARTKFFDNMDDHPRAVCEAAIAALKAEKAQ